MSAADYLAHYKNQHGAVCASIGAATRRELA